MDEFTSPSEMVQNTKRVFNTFLVPALSNAAPCVERPKEKATAPALPAARETSDERSQAISPSPGELAENGEDASCDDTEDETVIDPKNASLTRMDWLAHSAHLPVLKSSIETNRAASRGSRASAKKKRRPRHAATSAATSKSSSNKSVRKIESSLLQEAAAAGIEIPTSPAAEDYATNPYCRPPFKIACLILRVMYENHYKHVTLDSIYETLSRQYAYYRHQTSDSLAAQHRQQRQQHQSAEAGDPQQQTPAEDGVKRVKAGWKNTVRHALSTEKYFMSEKRRDGNPGRGGLWRVNLPDVPELLLKESKLHEVDQLQGTVSMVTTANANVKTEPVSDAAPTTSDVATTATEQQTNDTPASQPTAPATGVASRKRKSTADKDGDRPAVKRKRKPRPRSAKATVAPPTTTAAAATTNDGDDDEDSYLLLPGDVKFLEDKTAPSELAEMLRELRSSPITHDHLSLSATGLDFSQSFSRSCVPALMHSIVVSANRSGADQADGRSLGVAVDTAPDSMASVGGNDGARPMTQLPGYDVLNARVEMAWAPPLSFLHIPQYGALPTPGVAPTIVFPGGNGVAVESGMDAAAAMAIDDWVCHEPDENLVNLATEYGAFKPNSSFNSEQYNKVIRQASRAGGTAPSPHGVSPLNDKSSQVHRHQQQQQQQLGLMAPSSQHHHTMTSSLPAPGSLVTSPLGSRWPIGGGELDHMTSGALRGSSTPRAQNSPFAARHRLSMATLPIPMSNGCSSNDASVPDASHGVSGYGSASVLNFIPTPEHNMQCISPISLRSPASTSSSSSSSETSSPDRNVLESPRRRSPSVDDLLQLRLSAQTMMVAMAGADAHTTCH